MTAEAAIAIMKSLFSQVLEKPFLKWSELPTRLPKRFLLESQFSFWSGLGAVSMFFETKKK